MFEGFLKPYCYASHLFTMWAIQGTHLLKIYSNSKMIPLLRALYIKSYIPYLLTLFTHVFKQKFVFEISGVESMQILQSIFNLWLKHRENQA